MHHNKVGFASAAVVAAVLAFTALPGAGSAQDAGVLAGDDVVSLLVRLGVNDDAARDWDGSLEVAGGELLGLRDWRPRPANEVQGAAWKLASYKGPNFRPSAIHDTQTVGPVEYYRSPGLVVDVRGNGGSRLMFATANGEFEVRLADVAFGRRLRFLGGDVTVERVPGVERMTSDDYQNDFATILGGDGDEVWAAWLGYRDNANEILARRFDGQGWGDVQTLSEQPGDHYLVKMGRDGDGRPWVVYSAQVEGNWDLYARVLDGDGWSAAERLTRAPQPDVFHNLATDAEGNLWVVWQGFRDGAADIFARRYDGRRWSEAEQVSSLAGERLGAGDRRRLEGRRVRRLGQLRRRQLRRAGAPLGGRRVGRRDAGRLDGQVRGAPQPCRRRPGPGLGGVERERGELGEGHRLGAQPGRHTALRVAHDERRGPRRLGVAVAGWRHQRGVA